MRIMEIYEEVMNELLFNATVDDDHVTINAIKDKKIVGKIVIEFIIDAYREFEDVIEKGEMSDEEYDTIFPNDTFAKIEYLDVIDGEKGKGYAKQLMQRGMKYAKDKGETVMYLNASPMGFTGLNISDLTGFYNSFGFQTLIDSGHNVEMFANI